MREILFRGKCKDTGEWVEGHLIKDSTWCGTNQKVTVIIPVSNTVDVLGFGYEFDGYWDVDPETVGQFTGLYDRNGNRIFEGDYLSVVYFEKPKYVMFAHGTYWLVEDDPEQPDYSLIGYAGMSDIVGNIHDNKEKPE